MTSRFETRIVKCSVCGGLVCLGVASLDRGEKWHGSPSKDGTVGHYFELTDTTPILTLEEYGIAS